MLQRSVPAPVQRALGALRRRVREVRFALRQRAHLRTRPVPWSEIEKRCCEFPPRVSSADDLRAPLERLLVENVIPFWYPGVIDGEAGGYRLNHDHGGRYLGPAPRTLVAQTRMLWFFSRLARSPYGTADHLAAAHHGFQFLVDVMWDREFAGYHWSVDEKGRPLPGHSSIPETLVKDVLGQGFALFALSEYARASGLAEAERRARELFAVLHQHAYDRDCGGFLQQFDRAWRPLPRGLSREVDLQHKTFATQGHLLEALTAFVELSGDATARAALEELVMRATSSMVFQPLGIGSQVHTRDWKPLLAEPSNHHQYGHDLELISFVHEAQSALGSPPVTLSSTLRQVFASAVGWGLDFDHGGFFLSGPIGGPAFHREKVWWVQAEGLRTSLWLHRLTGEPAFLSVAARTLDWIVERQADWSGGEWHAVIEEDGTTSGMKAGPWKAAYHNGRALLSCLEMLAAPPGASGS